MENLSQMLAIPFFVIAILSLVIYLQGLMKATSAYIPNANTWLIWVLADILNVYTYSDVVHGEISAMIFPYVELAGAISIFVFCAYKKKFKRPDSSELFIFVSLIALSITAVFTENESLINLALQFLYIVGFMPTIKGIRSGENVENVFSYILSIVAILFFIGSIATDPQSDWEAFVSPVVFIIGDILVIFVSLKKEK
ncbi:MAG: hypothetical protein M3Q34_04090 [bacterium]|nr:hypothetical protein [bacterium]